MLDTPLGNLLPPLFQDEYEHLSLDELLDLLRVPPPEELHGDFDTNAMPMYNEIAFSILERGTPGRKALWEETKDTHPTALRAILSVLWDDPGQQTRVRKRLEKLLGSDDPIEIVIALEGFLYCSDRKARSRVLKFTSHPNVNVRARVLNYMTNLYPADAVPMLLDAFDDEDPLIGITAVYNISGLSALDAMPRVHEAVERLRKDHDPEVRYFVDDVLDHFYEPDDYGTTLLSEGLIELQQRRGKTRPIRKDAERAEKRGDIDSLIPSLVALVIADPEDQWARSMIRGLLVNEDGTFVSDLKPTHFLDAIYLQSVIGDWDFQEQILALRSSEDLEIVNAAYDYERFLDPVAAVESNLGLLSSPEPFLRSTAIERLQDIRLTEADPDVRARLAALRDAPDEGLRNNADIVLQPGWQARLKVFGLAATMQ